MQQPRFIILLIAIGKQTYLYHYINCRMTCFNATLVWEEDVILVNLA